MYPALPGFEAMLPREEDIVLTPDDVAEEIVSYFKPTGKILDPCRGDGAFYKFLPTGADWCEIREGKDFFSYQEQVDYIISNPPYSIFSDFLRHSFKVAANIIYLIPCNKIFNSEKMLREIDRFGGVVEIYVIPRRRLSHFPIGFCMGVVYFKKDYHSGMRIGFSDSLSDSGNSLILSSEDII